MEDAEKALIQEIYDGDKFSEIVETLETACFEKILKFHNPYISYFLVKRWYKYLSKKIQLPIKFRFDLKKHNSYMRENGDLRISAYRLFKTNILFIDSIHESGHFILKTSGRYQELLKLDREYLSQNKNPIFSPVEICANKITLLLIEKTGRESSNPEIKNQCLELYNSIKKNLLNE